MSVINRIVTRGMGKSRSIPGRAGLITLGLDGPVFVAIVEQAKTIIQHGRSATKRTVDNITVFAKLIKINGERAAPTIQGFIKIMLSEIRSSRIKLVENIRSNIRKAKIFIKRLK